MDPKKGPDAAPSQRLFSGALCYGRVGAAVGDGTKDNHRACGPRRLADCPEDLCEGLSVECFTVPSHLLFLAKSLSSRVVFVMTACGTPASARVAGPNQKNLAKSLWLSEQCSSLRHVALIPVQRSRKFPGRPRIRDFLMVPAEVTTTTCRSLLHISGVSLSRLMVRCGYNDAKL